MAEHKSDVVVLSRKPMTEMLATCHDADEGGRKGSRDSFVETLGSPRVCPNKLVVAAILLLNFININLTNLTNSSKALPGISIQFGLYFSGERIKCIRRSLLNRYLHYTKSAMP